MSSINTLKTKEALNKRRIALKSFLTTVIEGKLNKSLNWWCKNSGASEAAVRLFLKGDTDSLNSKTYEKLASFVGVKVSLLIGEDITPKVVPLMGSVGAGGEVHSRDNSEPIEYVDAPP